VETTGDLDHAGNVRAIYQKWSPENSPTILPASERAFYDLPQKRAKIIVIALARIQSVLCEGRDNVALAREGVIADNAPLCAETACKNFPAERRTPVSDGEREHDVASNGERRTRTTWSRETMRRTISKYVENGLLRQQRQALW